MKKILLLLLSSILLFSCDSAKKALQRGSYETACTMAIKKLQKKPSDEEHAKIFAVAYQKANQKNIDRIDYLKQSKEKKAWDEVLRLYKILARRQELAETVLPLRAGGRTINFEHINYNDQIIEAKNSAAYFHYNEGVRLMQGDSIIRMRSKSDGYPPVLIIPKPKDLALGRYTLYFKITIKGITITKAVALEYPIVVKHSDSNAWENLKDLIDQAKDGELIKIDGTITAPDGARNFTVKTKLSIEGLNGKNTDKLDANMKCRIFKVKKSGAELNVKDLSLINANATDDPTDDEGGAIQNFSYDAVINLTNVNIENCKAKLGGALFYSSTSSENTNFKDVIIKNCEAEQSGGSIYVSRGKIILNNVEISESTASNQGNAIKLSSEGQIEMRGASSITNCPATGATTSAKEAIYIDCATQFTKLYIKGASYLDDKCKIRLSESISSYSKAINIEEVLTHGDATKDTVATIMLNKYTDDYITGIPNKKVIYGDLRAGNIANYKKFKMDQANLAIDNEGKLYKKKISDYASKEDIKETIKNIESINGGSTNTVEDRRSLKGKYIFYKTNQGNFGVMKITDVFLNADLSSNQFGCYSIKFNCKTFNKTSGNIIHKAEDIILENTDIYDLDDGITGGEDIWLQSPSSEEHTFTVKNGAELYIYKDE